MGRGRRWKPDPPPIRLGEVREQGIDLHITCALCVRNRTLPLSTFDKLPDEMTTGEIAKLIRCTACNRRSCVSVYPDSRPWIWYLRRTGQRDRLPYWACFAPEEPERKKRGPSRAKRPGP